jgi:hypothetical protein
MSILLLLFTVLVVIHLDIDLPQGHLQGGGSLRRRGVLMETIWMPPIEWGMWGENWMTCSGHGVHRTQGGQGS